MKIPIDPHVLDNEKKRITAAEIYIFIYLNNNCRRFGISHTIFKTGGITIKRERCIYIRVHVMLYVSLVRGTIGSFILSIERIINTTISC
jgi:hypothetical protein